MIPGVCHFSPDPELGYLECKNQGYPDLHQVASSVIIGEIKKNVPFEGSMGCDYRLFLNFSLDNLLLSLGTCWHYAA